MMKRHRSLKTQQRTFFECRDLVHLRVGQASTPRRPAVPTVRVTFEHKLNVKGLPAESFFGPRSGNPIFTESLILAQDERWRRA